MKHIILILTLVLTGCANNQTKPCNSESCKRPLSTEADLVIWWSADMRDGLKQGENITRYTLNQ
ncbi:type III secretion protein [Marinomonas sp. A3A]|jgi:hypothetical protein|uniref:HrpT family type III secretion system protein n=1 Tax=Marinomonas TaxID=28253 RepID=UPI001BB3149B|nr:MULTISPECIES: HrpT family type III secretion system protein [Marinomonas]QUX90792.1 type III secretion protein [Marinomonas sp. A3A]